MVGMREDIKRSRHEGGEMKFGNFILLLIVALVAHSCGYQSGFKDASCNGFATAYEYSNFDGTLSVEDCRS
jgi:hypothetical protein